MINIRRLRIKANLTQEELALEVGVTQGSVAQWESGATCPAFNKISKIAKALHCTPNDILNEEGADDEHQRD